MLVSELKDSVPLPLGTEFNQRTVTAVPLIKIPGKNIVSHQSTDAEWPTTLTMDHNDQSVGIAVDYLGSWHIERGIEEVDLILIYDDDDEDWEWQVIVAFRNKYEALDQGRYELNGFDGSKLIPWTADSRLEKMQQAIDDQKTPIAYTDGEPSLPAHAMQTADTIHELNRMFGIGDLETLRERREATFRRVIPRHVRWRDADTKYMDLAKKVDQNSHSDNN